MFYFCLNETIPSCFSIVIFHPSHYIILSPLKIGSTFGGAGIYKYSSMESIVPSTYSIISPENQLSPNLCNLWFLFNINKCMCTVQSHHEIFDF